VDRCAIDTGLDDGTLSAFGMRMNPRQSVKSASIRVLFVEAPCAGYMGVAAGGMLSALKPWACGTDGGR